MDPLQNPEEKLKVYDTHNVYYMSIHQMKMAFNIGHQSIVYDADDNKFTCSMSVNKIYKRFQHHAQLLKINKRELINMDYLSTVKERCLTSKFIRLIGGHTLSTGQKVGRRINRLIKRYKIKRWIELKKLKRIR